MGKGEGSGSQETDFVPGCQEANRGGSKGKVGECEGTPEVGVHF